MPAGELREKVAFEEQAVSDSSHGIVAGDWEEQFRVSARIRPLIGSEPVIAQRLTGVQPVIITVRSNANARRIVAAWRVKNVRTGTLYQIRAVTPDETRDYIDLLCEAGVAQ